MILRFDDTNPSTEKAKFTENIIRDLKTLEIVPDVITYSSDYFDQIIDQMKKMIDLGLAYADDTDADLMKKMRDEGIESPYRNTDKETNLKRFNLMLQGLHDEVKKEEAKGAKGGKGKKEEEKKGGEEEKKEEEKKEEEKKSNWCMRAKIDMQHKVKCLRDPVFFRVKVEKHHRTGDKYKAYPTYDFTCPIVDALEGVTHCLRTIEYHDRNIMYNWVQEQLGLRKVTIYDFAKLNMICAVLSKRKLNWFVNNGIVEDWDDPRFPTVQGIMRRGMTVQALKLFMLEQGPSKNTNLQEWDKIWAMNKDVVDPVAPRYTAIGKSTAVKLIVENGPEFVEC